MRTEIFDYNTLLLVSLLLLLCNFICLGPMVAVN
jgi:hypothetical protein